MIFECDSESDFTTSLSVDTADNFNIFISVQAVSDS